MRFMVTFSFPAQTGNEVLRSGKIDSVLRYVMEDLKPEAAYFYPVNGQRGGHFIVNADDATAVLRVCEPFWFGLQADVSMVPVMNPDDLMHDGIGQLQGIASRYS